MKISKDTLQLLRTFTNINAGLVVKAGSEIRVVSETLDILACAVVPEKFPKDFALYDSRGFLNLISKLFEDGEPDLNFGEKFVTISDQFSSFEYWYSPETYIKYQPNDPQISDSDSVLTFVLTQKMLANLGLASTHIGLDQICFTNIDNTIKAVAMSKEDNTQNRFVVNVSDEPVTAKFSVFLKADRLRLFPGDYKFTVYNLPQKGLIVKAQNTTMLNLKYFIAANRDSKYDS